MIAIPHRVFTASAVAMLLCMAGAAVAQQPAGTAFTYQGQLQKGGVPLSTPADLRFTLWDTEVGGNQVGPIVTVDNVTVDYGLFTVELDFGASAFNGEARWLEIAVRAPAGGGNFVTLSPRQRLTSAPFSLATRGISVGEDGNVGIGLPAQPGDMLYVTAPQGFEAAIRGESDTRGVLGFATGDGVGVMGVGDMGHGVYGETYGSAAGICGWARATSGVTHGVRGIASSPDGYAGYFEGRGYFADKVGIGTPTPIHKLDVSGSLRALGAATVPAIELTGGLTPLIDFHYNDDPGDYTYRIRDEGALNFRSQTNLALSLAYNGNVGIRTSAPTKELEVAGDAKFTGGDVSVWSGNKAVTLRQDGTNTYLSNKANFVGNGAESNGRLVLNGENGVELRYGATGSSGELGLALNAAGNVGVGTAAPSYKLDVQTGSGTAVGGMTSATDEAAVFGWATAPSGFTTGIEGWTNSTQGTGVFGWAMGTSGTSITYGVWGWAEPTTGATHGGYFESDSTSGRGVTGVANSTTGTNHGVVGRSGSTSGRGVWGNATANSGTNYGVFGQTASSSGWAVWAQGRLGASGTKSFQIDHPLDPTNYYLNHYCAEAPEPLNIYSGNVITDSEGYAVVELPDYFEAINRDFRYQLTVIDDGERHGFVLAKVVQKIRDNQFVIRTSAPAVEVSWRVEAVRDDAWVRAYGAPTEQEKPAEHKGRYLHPELYGQPAEMGIHYEVDDPRPSLNRIHKLRQRAPQQGMSATD